MRRFADGRTGRITASMLSARLLSMGVHVVGSSGSLKVFNPTAPQLFGRITVTVGGAKRKKERESKDVTYVEQMKAFAGAVLRGEPFLYHRRRRGSEYGSNRRLLPRRRSRTAPADEVGSCRCVP